MAADINIRIGAKITELQKKLKQAERSLKRSGSKMQSIGTSLTMSLTAPIAALGGAAIKAAGDFEAMSNGLTAIMGDADLAAAELERLKEAAKNPGLGFAQAVKGSVRLQSIGLDADLARENMLAMGNAIALVGGGAEELDRATLAMQQIGAKGKVSAEEINQLNEVIPQIRAVMKDTFGTSEGQELAKMGVDANKFIEEITTGLNKLPRAQGGIKNAIENTGIAMQSFLSSLGMELNEAFNLQENVEAFANKLTEISERFASLDENTKKTILSVVGLAAAFGPALKLVGLMKVGYANLISVFSSALNSIKILIAKITLLTTAESRNAIVTKAKTKVMAVYNTVHAFASRIVNAFRISTIRSTAATIAQRAATIAFNLAVTISVATIQAVIALETAYVAVKSVLTGKIKLATVAQAALNAVLLANPIGIVIAAVAALIVIFVAAYQNIEGFRNFIDNAMSFIRDKFQKVMSKIKYLLLNLPSYLNASSAALAQFVKNVVNRLKIMSLKSGRFMKEFQKAFTISKSKRKKLQDEIDSIVADEEILADNAKSIADVFNERLAEGIENGEQIDTKKIKENFSDTADYVKELLGLGGSPITPSAPTPINETTEAIKEQKTEVASLATELKTLDSSNLKVASSSQVVLQNVEQTQQSMQRMSDKTSLAKQEVDAFNESVRSLAESGLQDLAVGLGEGIGAMASGAGNLQTIAGSMLSTIGGVLMQLGKLAIQTGIAIEGIKLALKSLNPAVAVAGGIALVALAKFVQNKAANLSESGSAKLPAFANGGLVTAPTLGMFGEAGPEALIPKKRLDSLLSKAENGGGGIGMLTTRISGNDLEIVLDKTRRRNNRVR